MSKLIPSTTRCVAPINVPPAWRQGQNIEVSFAVVNCRVKTLNCEDQHHGTTSEVHSKNWRTSWFISTTVHRR